MNIKENSENDMFQMSYKGDLRQLQVRLLDNER